MDQLSNRSAPGVAPRPPSPSRRVLGLILACAAMAAAVLISVSGVPWRAPAGRWAGSLPLFALALPAAAALLVAGAAAAALLLAGRMQPAARAAGAARGQCQCGLLERIPAGVYRTTADGRFLACNRGLARMLGYESEAELMRCNAFDLYDDRGVREAFLARLEAEGQIDNGESRLRCRDGAVLWCLENASWRPAVDGEGEAIEGALIDISRRKEAESRIAFLAYHDDLTGLANRALLLDRLAQALAKARRMGASVAVMAVNLDRFKAIDDTLGHGAGDRILRDVGARLQAVVRSSDTVARLGGDEFALLLDPGMSATDAAKVAQKLLTRIAQPLEIDGQTYAVAGSIGIGLYPDDGADVESLLRSARLALFRAKELGGGGYQLCTPAMNARAVARLALESELRRALERVELEVLYQPVVSFASGLTVAMEALVRWRHPQRGLVPPSQFIPLAEELRLEIPLGQWVLATALRQARSWQNGPLPGIRVAVNLSVLHFQDADLPRTVATLLREVDLDPECLDLEITESAAMQNIEQTVATLTALRRLGVRISMDDFGTGQASLGYLKRLPIDCLKIDRDFVRDLDNGATGEAIVTAIIDMAHGLGLKVIAEGVETESQFHFLNLQGCDEFQGYLVSRPLPPAEVEHQVGLGVLIGKAN
jgi:diguanylate cyclase (GGDEF)-like protein/PAS domain S-box-containing protein